MRAVAIVDGEHYPDVVRAALAELPYEFVGVMLVGGTEKLRGEPDYGVPLVDEPGDAEIASTCPTSPCSTRRRACISRAGSSPPGSRTSAPTSASTRRRCIRSSCRRSR